VQGAVTVSLQQKSIRINDVYLSTDLLHALTQVAGTAGGVCGSVKQADESNLV
jgi:hypothetical protein